MNTVRQDGAPGSGLPPLRGAHLHLHVDEADTRDITILRNVTLRGEFRYPDGRPVALKAGPRAALYALLSYRQEGADWVLDMDRFAGAFVETKTTVYAWIRVLEETGFVVRWRANDPVSGQFEWHLAAAARPGVLPGAVGNPQVGPSVQKGGDGAAPPVDGLETRRSDHPYEKPSMEKPTMVKPAHGDSYRETSKEELPASPPVPATRTNREEAAGESPRETQQRSLSLVRPTAATAEEKGLAADPGWIEWVTGLLDHPKVVAMRPLRPTRQDIDLLALRAQVAVEELHWTRDLLAQRVLLVQLIGIEHLGAVWLGRLHPENLSMPPAVGQKTRVELGQRVPDPMATAPAAATPPPSAERIAEIRQLHGTPRGDRWAQLEGKP